MASRVTVTFYYDVVSPYSWYVQMSGSYQPDEAKGLTGIDHTKHRLGFEAINRYKTIWNYELKLIPFFLGGIMQMSGTWLEHKYECGWMSFVHPTDAICLR
jgi:hypothetical protein